MKKIVKKGHPALNKVCEEVDPADVKSGLIQTMIGLMRAANGIGLAAPQVGETKRFFVYQMPGEKAQAVFNPKIIESSGLRTEVEECLSLPGESYVIDRPSKVTVEGYDKNGNTIVIEADGWKARMLQHEIDHLNGVLVCDHGGNL